MSTKPQEEAKEQEVEDDEDHQELMRKLPGFMERLTRQQQVSGGQQQSEAPASSSQPSQASIAQLKHLSKALAADPELRERLCGSSSLEGEDHANESCNLVEQLRSVFLGSLQLVQAVTRQWSASQVESSSEGTNEDDSDPAADEDNRHDDDSGDLVQLRLCAQLWSLLQIACTLRASAVAVSAAAPIQNTNTQEKKRESEDYIPSTSDSLGNVNDIGEAQTGSGSLLQQLVVTLLQLSRGLAVRPEAPVGNLLLRSGFRLLCNISAHGSNPSPPRRDDAADVVDRGEESVDPQAAVWQALWTPAGITTATTAPTADFGSSPRTSALSQLVALCQEEGPLEPLSSLVCHLLVNCIRGNPERAHRLVQESVFLALHLLLQHTHTIRTH